MRISAEWPPPGIPLLTLLSTDEMDSSPGKSPPSLIDRLSTLLSREPEDRDELLELLRSACERSLLDADALSIIEGALQISELQARDVMVPRARMDAIHLSDSLDRIVAFVVETGHSRFPAIGEDKDDIAGILLTKDLLRYFAGEAFAPGDLRAMLRPAVFVPESKRLNMLLRDFRVSHNHMAIVVDEYGGVAGLVTIEDVLEQIVGDIEDEYDHTDVDDSIRLTGDGRYRVKASVAVGAFNTAFATTFSAADADTLGGLVIRELGRLPQHGEIVHLGGFEMRVLRADARRIHMLLIERLPDVTAVVAESDSAAF